MQFDETTTPVSSHQPVEIQSALPNLLLGRTLDKTVESQRRRLLAVSIPGALTREDVAAADEALDQLSLTFFSTPNESLANAFGAALKAVKRPTKSALVAGKSTGFTGGLVAAALDGQRLVVSAAEPGLVIVQQGDQIFSFPRTRDAGDEFLDPSSTIFETKLDPGDIVALLSSGRIDDRDSATALTRHEVAEIAGEQGAWVWIELEKPRRQDLRHKAGLLSPPEPEAQRTWSTTANPADPLWTKSRTADGAMFQKPPALDTLQRYRSTSGDSFTRGARTRLPRGRPSVLLLGSLLLALLLIGSGVGYLYTNRPQSVELPDPQIAQHTAALASALSGDDPAAIEQALPAAERALTIGQKADMPAEELALLQTEIMHAHDWLDGTLRLTDVTLLGQLPESLAKGDPRLGESAGVVYLLSPTPYQVDLTGLTLIGMPFSPASQIKSFATQSSGEDVAGVIASDGTRLVLMTNDGIATELGVTVWPQGVDPTAGIVTGFQNRLYLFDEGSGEIYYADGQDNNATRWLLDTEPPLQTGALGMEITGVIHVVYPDGHIISMSSGEVYSRQELGSSQSEFEALAVDSGEETGDLYVAVVAGGSSHIEIFDPATGGVTQILLPPASVDGQPIDDILENVTSLAVSETRGQVFWIEDGNVWSATLPETPSAE
ncbi:MAG: hypothetical protein KC438_00135 [Thermomicrobiales bacterium]|nr:hypothetical protein [Thermomicrobiales bacterium]